MKKIVAVALCVLTLQSMPVLGENVTGRVPTFDVTFNGIKVESSFRQFPLLVYKDITYVPMTYYDCRFLGLKTDWDADTRTLSIEKSPVTCAWRDYKWEWENGKTNATALHEFGIRYFNAYKKLGGFTQNGRHAPVEEEDIRTEMELL